MEVPLADASLPMPQSPAEQLPGQKRHGQHWDRGEAPSQSRQHSEPDDERDGGVDCQEPCQGVAPHPRPPVAEREIHDENSQCDLCEPRVSRQDQ